METSRAVRPWWPEVRRAHRDAVEPAIAPASARPAPRFDTPTGAPFPRVVRGDGTIEGTGHCVSCGCCLLLLDLAWPDDTGH